MGNLVRIYYSPEEMASIGLRLCGTSFLEKKNDLNRYSIRGLCVEWNNTGKGGHLYTVRVVEEGHTDRHFVFTYKEYEMGNFRIYREVSESAYREEVVDLAFENEENDAIKKYRRGLESGLKKAKSLVTKWENAITDARHKRDDAEQEVQYLEKAIKAEESPMKYYRYNIVRDKNA